MTTDESGNGRLSSVAAALRLLKQFSVNEPELGITEMARRLGVAKSTAHRLASTLAAEGFLEQTPGDGRYRLGLELFAIGSLVRRRMDVSAQALPHLHQLRDRSHETVQLAVLEGTDVMVLFNLESPQAIRARSYLGVRKPAFCTSEGRALLAHSAPALLARVLRSSLKPRTPHTVVDPAELSALIASVRQSGHAIDDEESELGMRGVAAPVFDAQGHAVAAVGLAGPSQRLTKKSLRRFAPLVIETAQAISTRLGHGGPA